MSDIPVIIVTGCARSGTSLVAGILNKCGAYQGHIMGRTRWNKKGQFENNSLRDHMTKPYLRRIGADPMGQDPLPPLDVPVVDDWDEKFLSLMRGQDWDGIKPLMVKEAKACLMWQVWDHVFPNAKWVVVRRKDKSVIDSCLKTSFMRKRKTRESWQEWIVHHKVQFQRMKEAGLWMLDVWPEMFFRDSGLNTMKSMVIALGLSWKEANVLEFIDHELWH